MCVCCTHYITCWFLRTPLSLSVLMLNLMGISQVVLIPTYGRAPLLKQIPPYVMNFMALRFLHPGFPPPMRFTSFAERFLFVTQCEGFATRYKSSHVSASRSFDRSITTKRMCCQRVCVHLSAASRDTNTCYVNYR